VAEAQAVAERRRALLDSDAAAPKAGGLGDLP
jgi:hypothetical protein